MNRVVTVTAPLSRVTVYGYDSGGNLVKVTDPMGRVTTIAYDALDRPDGGDRPADGSSNAVTTTVYDAEGQSDPGDRPDGPDHDDGLRQPGLGGHRDRPAGQRRRPTPTRPRARPSITDPSSSGGSTESYLLRQRRSADDVHRRAEPHARSTATTAWATRRPSRMRMATRHPMLMIRGTD